MEYVANLLNGDVDPAAWARQREDEGWDVLGCADHLFSPRRAYPHVWVTLATFAAATSRPRLTSSLRQQPAAHAGRVRPGRAADAGRLRRSLRGWPRRRVGRDRDHRRGARVPARRRTSRPLRGGHPDRAPAARHGCLPVPRRVLRHRHPDARAACRAAAAAGRLARWPAHDPGDRAARRSCRAEARQRGHQGWRARRRGPRLDPATARRRTGGEGPARSTRRCRSA